jgi:4-oxalocrotonate tautomerase
MPVVELKVLGTLTLDQKREITKQFTKTLETVAKKPPAYTHVIIQEVPNTNWGNEGALFADS